MLFILAQLFGIISLLIYCVGVQVKKKENVLVVSILTNFFDSMQYLCLNAITGSIISLVNAFRCLAFYSYEKKYSKPSKILFAIFVIIALICGGITYKNIFSILPITASIISTYGMWQRKATIARIGLLLSCTMYIIYSLQAKAYSGAITFLVMFVATLISIIRNDVKFGGNK